MNTAKLYDYLSSQGLIIIGDVSTLNRLDMNKLQKMYDSIWDDEEYYPILDIYQKSDIKKYYKISYTKTNEVAGLFELIKI